MERMNRAGVYSKSQINKIFPEISFDNFNVNSEANNIIDDYFINDNLPTYQMDLSEFEFYLIFPIIFYFFSQF